MSQRSIENVEDRVIKMAKTLVRHLDQPKIAYRTNGKLSPKVKKTAVFDS